MHWIFLAPFNSDPDKVWLFRHGSLPGQTAEVVQKTYQHDRSRKVSGITEWRDFFWHALRGVWRARVSKGRSGFITAFPQLTACLAALKLLGLAPRKAPLVAWYFNMNRPYGGVKGWLARAVMHQVDCFVVHSRGEIATYSKWLKLPPSRFRFVPLTAVEPTVKPGAEKKIPEGGRFVLSMGSANRDYRSLVSVLAELNYPAIIVAGPHALAGLEIPPNIEVRSGVTIEECHALAAKATINVVPIGSPEAASGQVTLIETMYLGAALVVTRCVGTEDYVEDGTDALLVPAGDVAALKGAIGQLWNSAETCQSLARNARRAAEQRFTPEAVVPALQEILSNCAKERR